MCLAIPGKILSIDNDDHGVCMARTDFGGIVKQVCLAYVPEAVAGDYVLVHVGFAIGTIDEAEAARTFEALKSMDQLGELDDPQPVPDPPGTNLSKT